MRIAFLAWRDLANPLAGGSEILVDRLASGLVQRGHDVTLYCGGPVAPRSYEVVDLGGTYGQYLRAPFALARHAAEYDVVVDVCNGIPFFSPLWQRQPTVCLVNHVHTDQWRLWFAPPVAAVGRALESRAVPRLYRRRLFVGVSPSTARSVNALGVPASSIRVVPNGVAMPEETWPKSPTPLFVAASRLVPHKRLDLLLDAWPEVRSAIGGELVILGEGPERSLLESRLTIGASLRGFVSEDEKARLMTEAWLLLHPSQLEGWGLVIMEAAARGTPTLGFDVNGVRDAVSDGVTGVLATSHDDFVRQWIALGRDAARRDELAAGAVQRATEFSWDRTVSGFEAVLTEARAQGAMARPATVIPWAPVPELALSQPVLQPAVAARPAGGLSLVVPAYNEVARLSRSLPAIARTAGRLGAELIVVDDGSSDGTAQMARDLLGGGPQTRVLELERHRGKGAAVRAGVEASTQDLIAYVDADMATDMADLPVLLRQLDTVHIAVGSRAAAGSSTSGATMSRTIMGRSFNRLARTVTRMSIQDFQCGFKAFRAPAARLLFDLGEVDGFAFDVEILSLARRIGYRLAEIPVHWEAVAGSHVRPLRDSLQMGTDVLRLPARWTYGRVLTALQARQRDAGAMDVIAALSPYLQRVGPLVPWEDGALALLPFVDSQRAMALAEEVQHELPTISFDLASVRATEILHGGGALLRDRLAAG